MLKNRLQKKRKKYFLKKSIRKKSKNQKKIVKSQHKNC